MNELQLSTAGFNALKQSEGNKLKAYQDQKGIWTIGYGHTGKVNGSPIHQGMVITPEERDRLLHQDIQRFEKLIRDKVKVQLTQNQFDSLVNFAFNVGDGAFADSTLLKHLNLGNYTEAGNQLLRWNKTGDKVNEGLTNRRHRERALFFGEDLPIPKDYSPAAEPYDTAPQTMPNTALNIADQLANFAVPQQNSEQFNTFTQLNTLEPIKPQAPTSETISPRKKYEKQLADAFGIMPETTGGLPDHIGDLVRSVFDQTA